MGAVASVILRTWPATVTDGTGAARDRGESRLVTAPHDAVAQTDTASQPGTSAFSEEQNRINADFPYLSDIPDGKLREFVEVLPTIDNAKRHGIEAKLSVKQDRQGVTKCYHRFKIPGQGVITGKPNLRAFYVAQGWAILDGQDVIADPETGLPVCGSSALLAACVAHARTTASAAAAHDQGGAAGLSNGAPRTKDQSTPTVQAGGSVLPQQEPQNDPSGPAGEVARAAQQLPAESGPALHWGPLEGARARDGVRDATPAAKEKTPTGAQAEELGNGLPKSRTARENIVPTGDQTKTFYAPLLAESAIGETLPSSPAQTEAFEIPKVLIKLTPPMSAQAIFSPPPEGRLR